jgi:hypothetical protein
MNKKFATTGLILIIILATVLISGCVGGDSQTSDTNNAEGALKNEAKVNEILTNYDLDNDGKIDPYEFGVWGGSVGLDVDDAEAMVALFNKYDANGDGFLDKNELDVLVEDYK